MSLLNRMHNYLNVRQRFAMIQMRTVHIRQIGGAIRELNHGLHG